MKTDGAARCRLKSNGRFTISLPVRIFVNHRKNYHFTILTQSNHNLTLFWLKWTFWVYLEFIPFTYIVIITIFHLHGLIRLLNIYDAKNYVFSPVYEPWILMQLMNKILFFFSTRYKYHFYNLRSVFSLFSIFDGL